MKRLSVILVSFLLYLPLSAQFKGTVYVDTDQSGLFNKGDKRGSYGNRRLERSKNR